MTRWTAFLCEWIGHKFGGRMHTVERNDRRIYIKRCVRCGWETPSKTWNTSPNSYGGNA